MKKAALTVIFLLLATGFSFAQGVRFVTQVSSTNVSVDEPFRIQFSVENASHVSGFDPPPFRGFQVLSRSQSQSTSIVNGKVSQSISFVFVLKADVKGRFTIAGASARVNGNKMKSNPITITVEEGNSGANNNSNNNPPPASSNPFSFPTPRSRVESRPGMLKKGENAMDKIKKNVFVRVNVDKTNVYVGEQITATYKLYTRLPTSSQVTKVPSFTGFSAHDIKLSNPPRATIEEVHGEPFKVFTIRKTMLFPLQAGDLELDPVEIDNTVRLYQIKRSKQNNDPFADIFNDPFFQDPFGNDPFNDPFFQNAFGGGNVTYHDYDYHITSNPVTIHVKPLPAEGKPNNFDGAVGNFHINASLDKTKLSTDDAVTLKVTISGQGNITLLNAPTVHFPNDFESYDPKVSDKINASNPFGGSRTFSYVIMPKDAGDFTIPPVSFSYFDPDAEQYKTIKTTSFALAVTPGKNQPAIATNYAKAGSELQPIRTGTLAWNKPGLLWFGAWWPWLLMLLPIIVLIILFLLKKQRDTLYSNQALLKNKKANKVALKRLSLANKYFQQQKSKAFYGEVSQAVWGYLCDKLNIPFAELSKQKAEEKLLEKQVNGTLPERLFGLLDHCEMALYAGMSGQEQMKDTYDQAVNVVSELESKLKKT